MTYILIIYIIKTTTKIVSVNEVFQPNIEQTSFKTTMLDSEKAKADQQKRSLREIQELKDRLRFVAKILSKNFGLRLVPGEAWATGFSEVFEEERRRYPEKSLEEFDQKLLAPEIITYSEKDFLDRSEDYIFGIFRREVGHLKHSDYRPIIEAQEDAKKEGYRPVDLFMIYNAWEDGRSNALEGRTSAAAKRRLGRYLQEDIADALMHDLEKKPLPVQYSALCWAKGAEPFLEGFDFEALKSKIKDSKVLKAYEETQSALAEYLRESKGRKAFQEIFWRKGWPVFKELIEKYVKEEAKRQFEESENKARQKNGENKSQQGQKQGETQKESGEKKSGGEGMSSGENQEGVSQEGKLSEGGQQERSLDDLTPEEKEKYHEAAREKLTEEEREFVERIKPKSVELTEKEDSTLEIKSRKVNNEDVRKAEAQEKEYKEKEAKLAQQINKTKQEVAKAARETEERFRERATGLTKEDREQYNRYYDQIRKYVNILVERLDEVFPPQEEVWEGGRQRGKRIDARRLAREIPTEHGKFFETKEIPDIREAVFTLLIDVSNSMRGRNIVEALKAAILMAEAFSKKGLPFEILAFHDQLLELKGFDEEYFGKKKLKIMSVLKEVETSNAQWNDDGYAVDTAARRLQRKLLENNAAGVLIVFSDGKPVPSALHAGDEWELHDIVRKWSKQLPLIGVGIGYEMETTIIEYYDKNGLPVPDVGRLQHAFLKILSNQLARFEKRDL